MQRASYEYKTSYMANGRHQGRQGFLGKPPEQWAAEALPMRLRGLKIVRICQVTTMVCMDPVARLLKCRLSQSRLTQLHTIFVNLLPVSPKALQGCQELDVVLPSCRAFIHLWQERKLCWPWPQHAFLARLQTDPGHDKASFADPSIEATAKMFPQTYHSLPFPIISLHSFQCLKLLQNRWLWRFQDFKNLFCRSRESAYSKIM